MKCNFLGIILLTGLFFTITTTIQAQENTTKPKSEFWSKVRFGGGLGLNFGRNNTNITVAPSALYQPNQYQNLDFHKHSFPKTQYYLLWILLC